MEGSWVSILSDMEDWNELEPRGSHEISFDQISIDDDKSSSYRSESIVSSGITSNSHGRSRRNLSVSSRSDRSTNNSRFSKCEKFPSAESEGEILNLLAGSGYPMTQINGQRKLGPPPGWTKPPPDPNCEVFVGKLPRDVYEYTIYPIFHQIGEIYEIRLMMDFSGTNRGYCFIMFTKAEYAQRAIKELNNWEIRKGRRIGVVASINNCRLSVSQLPSDIDSKIIVQKFYDNTDDVSKVSVYKNYNGEVRYALVSYKTHRGAAMARRRLLPERATLFEHGEVSIDWAHPDMLPNNVVEEVGVRDEKGFYKFSRMEIGHLSKRGFSHRRGRDDFLDKSIKNYLQDNQRNKSLEMSGQMEKFNERRATFSGRKKNLKSRSNQQKTSNHYRVGSNKENIFTKPENPSLPSSVTNGENFAVSKKENILQRMSNPDINGNIEIDKISHNGKKAETIKDPLNVFEHYTSLPELSLSGATASMYEQTPSATTHDQFVPMFYQNENNNQAEISFGNSMGFNCQDNELKMKNSMALQPFRNHEIIIDENSSKLSRNPRKISGSMIVENSKIDQRSKKLPNFRVLNQITNLNNNHNSNVKMDRDNRTKMCEGALIARGNSNEVTKENINPQCRNFREELHNHSLLLQQRANYQSILVNRHGFHFLNNYFRAFNSFSNNSISVIDNSSGRKEIVFPLERVVPQSYYGTSSFADYPMARTNTERGHPRPILNRTFARIGDEN